jgi:hypothetical protein
MTFRLTAKRVFNQKNNDLSYPESVSRESPNQQQRFEITSQQNIK